MTTRNPLTPDAPAASGSIRNESPAIEWDLARREGGVRALNQWLHHDASREGASTIRVLNPDGQHHIAAGLNAPLHVEIA
ncbi:MAG TPA: hypothetical protein VGP63_04385, partial [Planctomycetaceae bacterium]|nr:hypothetical protein [Planctomycetaceae bacterium]